MNRLWKILLAIWMIFTCLIGLAGLSFGGLGVIMSLLAGMTGVIIFLDIFWFHT